MSDIETQKLQQSVVETTKSLLEDNDISEQTKESLNRLHEAYHACGQDEEKLGAICKAMLENGILEVWVRLWDRIHEADVYQNLTLLRGTTLQFLKELFWNMSDKCDDLSKAACKHGKVIPRLMSELASSEIQLDTLEDDFKRHHIKATFGILHNFVRLYEDNKKQIRQSKGLKSIKHFFESPYLIVKAYAYILVAYCVSRDEMETFLPGDEVFGFMVTLLKSALDSKDHVGAKYGLSLNEVVDATSKLISLTDANKECAVSAGILPELTKVLDPKKFSEDEMSLALNCVWYLTLGEETKASIEQDAELKPTIKKLLEKSNSNKIRRASRDILHLLSPEDGEYTQGKHVMISYQWDSQEKMKELYQYLEKEGFELWMDVRHMGAKVIDSMAEAVENASIVVIGATERYKKSSSCEKEAKYADSRKVPILPLLLDADFERSGWLGLLMGDKLYVDLTGPDYRSKFEEVREKLEQYK